MCKCVHLYVHVCVSVWKGRVRALLYSFPLPHAVAMETMGYTRTKDSVISYKVSETIW